MFYFSYQPGYCDGTDEGYEDKIKARNSHEELMGPCGNMLEYSEERGVA